MKGKGKMQRWMKGAGGFFLLLVLGLSGCREEFPKTIYYDDVSFSISLEPQELCDRLNSLRTEGDSLWPVLGLDHDAANYYDDYFGERLYFKTKGYTFIYDTIPVRTPEGDTIEGDPYRLMERRVPVSDTQYITPDGFFRHPLTITDSTKGSCDEIFALLRFNPDQKELTLKLIRMGSCTVSFEIPGGGSSAPYMQALFEQQVIAPLK